MSTSPNVSVKDWYDRLHSADCIEALQALDPTSVQVDLVFADPPYNIGFSYDVYDDNLDDQAYLRWTERWMQAAARVLKPTGALWIAIGDEYAAEVKPIGVRLGLHLRSWVIWYYTFGVNCKQKFSRSHTHLLYFVKDPRQFTFNDMEIRVPSARQLVYNDLRADSRGRLPDNTWILRPQDAPDGFRPDQDTWYFARVAGTFKERAGFHGCQLPERLLERIIRCCTDPHEVVLDPFAGSGSTLVVAKKLGRRWVGYELSPEYVRHAQARIDAVRAGDPIEGPEDPLTSAPSTPLGRHRRHVRADEGGIVEAFRAASGGFSVDRVVADPALNAAFIDQCSIHGLAGRPRDWNLTLMGLRKGNRLAGVFTTNRTEISSLAMDPYEFASEMALRRMLDMGYPSVDFILCDPLAAARFDDLARSLAPGFRSLEYRWAALRLRKEARVWRSSAERLGDQSLELSPQRVSLRQELAVAGLPRKPGVYLLLPDVEDAWPAYVGETWDLRGRAQRTLQATAALDQLLPNSGHWQLEFFELDGVDQAERRGLQSVWIARTKPRLNYLELACPDAVVKASSASRIASPPETGA